MNNNESEYLIPSVIPQFIEKVKLTNFTLANKDSSHDLLNRLNATNIPHRQNIDKTDIFNTINSGLFFLVLSAIWSLYWFVNSLFD